MDKVAAPKHEFATELEMMASGMVSLRAITERPHVMRSDGVTDDALMISLLRGMDTKSVLQAVG